MTALHFSLCINRARLSGNPHFAQAMVDVFTGYRPSMPAPQSRPVFQAVRSLRELPPHQRRAAVKASFSASPFED